MNETVTERPAEPGELCTCGRPVGPECESCGRLDELAVVTEETTAGVICMTVCDACEMVAVVPVLSPAEEATRVREHAQHVGLN